MNTLITRLVDMQSAHADCLYANTTVTQTDTGHTVAWPCGGSDTVITSDLTEAGRRHIAEAASQVCAEWLTGPDTEQEAARAIAADLYSMQGGDLTTDTPPDPNTGDMSLAYAVVQRLASRAVNTTDNR